MSAAPAVMIGSVLSDGALVAAVADAARLGLPVLEQLEKTNPHVRSVMANALRNVRPTHLLDRDVARAWAERSEDIRPQTLTTPRKAHAPALPVTGKLRLPVVD